MTRKLSHVKVSEDKGNLRIQFSRRISREIFGVNQKYWYLRLNNTAENHSVAQGIAAEMENDINALKLNQDLDSYLPCNKLKKEIGIQYNPYKIEVSLLNLFDLYVEAIIKNSVAVTTYVLTYQRRYRRIIASTPQNLNEQYKIVEFIHKNNCGENFQGVCLVIQKMIDWGKNHKLIPELAPNQIEEIQKDYKVIFGKYRPPAFLYEYIPGYVHDYDYKAFTASEANIIIKEFEKLADNLMDPPIHTNASWRVVSPSFQESRKTARDIVKLKLWTGCRTCEASALRWLDISKNFDYLVFRNAYSAALAILKPLKTEYVGLEETASRKFPCQEKLSILLEDIYKRNSPAPEDYLFLNGQSKTVFTSDRLTAYWYGRFDRSQTKSGPKKYFKPGVIANLVKEGKLFQYLKPYATRNTWIVHQLNNNVPVNNIAKMAGNSPMTIYKNYASYIPDIPFAPEL